MKDGPVTKYDPGTFPLEYRARGFSQQVNFQVSLGIQINGLESYWLLLISPIFTFSKQFHLDVELNKKLVKFDPVKDLDKLVYTTQQYLRAYQQAYPGDISIQPDSETQPGRCRYQPLIL